MIQTESRAFFKQGLFVFLSYLYHLSLVKLYSADELSDLLSIFPMWGVGPDVYGVIWSGWGRI